VASQRLFSLSPPPDGASSCIPTLTCISRTPTRRWVKAQAAGELWTDGVEDYLRYARELVRDFGDVLDSTPEGPSPAKAAKAQQPAGGFSFGGAAAGAGSQPAASSGFLFGAPPPTAAAAAPAQPFTGFNFGASAPAPAFGAGAFGGQPSAGGGGAPAQEEEEEAEEEPSVEVELGTAGVEILCKHRAKLMSLVDGAWSKRGPGTLTVRRPAAPSDSGGRAPYLVFTTDTGRVMISAPLLKGVKPVVQPKQAGTVLLMLVNTAGGEEERGMHGFQCEGAAAAQELVAEINSHV
jgi:hypothetical protein